MDKQPLPETMLEAVRQFGDPQAAHDFFVQMRWPNGVACPLTDCGSMAVAYMPQRRRWYCNDCKKQFTAKVGTIFEDSPIGFDKWLPAFWLIASNRNGISSYELSRALKVTQRTAWFMLHRIREAMRDESYRMLSGEVEADETYIGGKRRRANIGSSNTGTKPQGPRHNKAIVLGMMERGGPVRAFVIPDDKAATIIPKVEANVEFGSRMYTDSHRAYYELPWRYRHEYVNHMVRYVEGHVHTNHIENFWSVLKRMLRGTYISVQPKHLERYLHEEIFRFNERKNHDGPRFVMAVRRADQKRLTYKSLTGVR